VEDALMAFFDRFLLRVPVLPVSDAAFTALLQLGEASAPPAVALTDHERAALTAAAPAVALPEPVLQALQSARAWLQTQAIAVSDRRWRQLVRLLQVQAASEGRAAVDVPDLWLLPCAVAPEPDAVPRVAQWVAEQLLQVRTDDATGLTRAVEAFERQLELEQRANPDEADNAAGKMALAQAMTPRGEPEGGMVRLLSASLENQLVQRYSPVHVAARVAQLDEVLAGARPRRDAAALAHRTLAAQLAGRLWCPPSLVQGWLGVLAHSHDTLAQLVARAEAARAGFAALPLDEQAAASVPTPLTLS
jgi:MoxR-like ATPase